MDRSAPGGDASRRFGNRTGKPGPVAVPPPDPEQGPEPDEMPPPDLVVHDLRKTFSDGGRVLDGISFSVPRGQAVALIGANGAGKSTLLRCCLRLIPCDGGDIVLFGETLPAKAGERRLRRLRARSGFVFQRHNLVPRLSALSNVLHGAQGRQGGPGTWFHSLAPGRLRDEAQQCLDRVGLADLATRRVDRLSGGQSQRVAIARALMQRPRLIFADEPVASLDPSAGEEVMALFVDLIRHDGVSLVFTSHNLRHALDHADRVLGLRDGRLVLDSPSAEQTLESLRRFYD